MRLDHLLSKENRVFLFCHCGGCLVRRLVVAKFLFSGKTSAAHALLCVGFLELMKQGEAFSALLVVRGFAEQQVCLCFGLFCCVACCWVSRAARLLFYKITPFGEQDLFAGCGPCFWVVSGWVLFVGWCVV